MVIDAGHKGPVLAYMAKVASATGAAPSQGWFKIYHDGLTSDGKWAVDRLVANRGKVDVKIPTCIQDGDYLLRGELIALHGAGSQNGARKCSLCERGRRWGLMMGRTLYGVCSAPCDWWTEFKGSADL